MKVASALAEALPFSSTVFDYALLVTTICFAAGAMIFISIHELIPMARRYQQAGAFVGGTIVSLIVYGLLARMTVG